MSLLTDALFALSPKVRYVAVLAGKELLLRERPGLTRAVLERLASPTR